MTVINWTSFTRKIAIKASVKDIYDAWTISSNIEKWFLKEAIYYDHNKQAINNNESIKPGYTYQWSWFLYDEIEKGNIREANGDNFIQFTFAGECLVEINLSQLDKYVIVELTQKNIPTDDYSKKEIRLGCESGWAFYLVNLKSVYENGYDLRNKNNMLKGLINN